MVVTGQLHLFVVMGEFLTQSRLDHVTGTTNRLVKLTAQSSVSSTENA